MECMSVELNLSNVKNFEEFLAKIKFDLNLESSNHTLKIYCLNSELSKNNASLLPKQKATRNRTKHPALI